MQLRTLGPELQEHLLYTAAFKFTLEGIKRLQVLLGKVGHTSVTLFFSNKIITAGACNSFAWYCASLI